MISTTPYLIRAIYDWCMDQNFTPHMLVDASIKGVVVPQHLVENDTIVLNIQAAAVKNLELGDDWIVFNARFSGQAMEVNVPVVAVRAIFARENGLGCSFEVPQALTPEEAAQALDEINDQIAQDKPSIKAKAKVKTPKKPKKKKPHLKLVD